MEASSTSPTKRSGGVKAQVMEIMRKLAEHESSLAIQQSRIEDLEREKVSQTTYIYSLCLYAPSRFSFLLFSSLTIQTLLFLLLFLRLQDRMQESMEKYVGNLDSRISKEVSTGSFLITWS